MVCDVRGLGLSHLSALVCDLLSRMGVYPVISWKVGAHMSYSLCFCPFTGCGRVALEYGFEVLI